MSFKAVSTSIYKITCTYFIYGRKNLDNWEDGFCMALCVRFHFAFLLKFAPRIISGGTLAMVLTVMRKSCYFSFLGSFRLALVEQGITIEGL